MIPKKIFQTWKTKKMSKEFEKITNSWKFYNPNYDYIIHDNQDCEFFLKNNFDKNVFYTYDKIIPGAFKADLWRVCVLYKFGGFYCDIDTLCLNKIDNFIKPETEFISVIDLNQKCTSGHHNLFNSFIGVKPNSSIMKFCIDRIIYNVSNNLINIPALDFSSCGVLGRALNNYLKLDETSSFLDKIGFNNEINLLKILPDTEVVCDINGKFLFQNKNGNYRIKKIYEQECKINKVVSWFYCDNWLRKKIFI